MVRRKPPGWISQTHERILEYVNDLGEKEAASPQEMADEYGRDPTYISREAGNLADAGFLLKLGRGVYQITDKGRYLLSGEKNFEDEPEPGD